MYSLKHSPLSIVVFLVLSKSPPPVVLLGFPTLGRMRRDWGFHFVLLRAIHLFLSADITLKNPTVKTCGNDYRITYQNFTTIQRLMSLGLYFYRNSFEFLWERKKLRCEGYFSQLWDFFKIHNGENSWNWVANVVLKFYDDPIVNESKIVVFLRHVWWAAGKKR